MPPKYLTVKAAAERASVAKTTVRSWIKKGHLNAKKHRATGQLYIPMSEWERWMGEYLEDREPGSMPENFLDDADAEDLQDAEEPDEAPEDLDEPQDSPAPDDAEDQDTEDAQDLWSGW